MSVRLFYPIFGFYSSDVEKRLKGTSKNYPFFKRTEIIALTIGVFLICVAKNNTDSPLINGESRTDTLPP